MSDAVIIALIGALIGGGTATGIISWIRGRSKDKVDVEAQRQVALSEIFDNATDLQKYVQEQVEKAVAKAIEPLEKQLEELKKASHRVHDAFRSFFTQIWVWDNGGRKGQMPAVPADILVELRLGHFLELPFEDTLPTKEEQ